MLDARVGTIALVSTGELYEWLIGEKFAQWRASCFPDGQPVRMVQDHERCLWQGRDIVALSKAKCKVVSNYPNISPDLNAIEGVWDLLRQRLQLSEPTTVETREAFLSRLRRTVHKMNEDCYEALLDMCTNQKQRANELIACTVPAVAGRSEATVNTRLTHG